jgi:hypothetical protein
MAKAIKSALIAAFVTFVTFVVLGPAGLGLSLGVSAGTAAVVSGVTTLIASGVAMLTSKGIDANRGNLGTKLTARNATAGRQIVYGECRVGGTVLHMQTTGTDNNRLHMIVAIAGHEIEDLHAIRFNDTNVELGQNTTTSTIGGQTVHTVTSSAFTNTDNDHDFGSGRLIRFSFHDGSQTAACGFARNELASIPSTHVFKDTAYVYVQMVYDPEKLPNPPQMSYHVKGKKVYDPRNGSTAYSSNPALIIRDFISNTTYGLKATSSEINDTTNAGGFSSAANTCDQNATDPEGANETRYTCNGFTTMIAAPDGILEGLLASCAGKMTYTNGMFNLFAGAAQTPSLTITDDVLIGHPSVSTRPANGDIYNTVKPVFVDKNNNFTGTDGGVFTDTTALNADTPSGESTANYVRTMEVQMPYVTSRNTADRLAKIALRHSRQSTTMQVLTTIQFMKLQPCDWVYVTNSRLGYTNKVFEVVSTNLEIVNDADVPTMATALSLKEIDSSVFNHAQNEYTTEFDEGSTVTAGDNTVTAPSSLTLSQVLVKEGGTAKINVLASWSNNSSPYIRITEVAYKLSTNSDYSAFIVGAGIDKVTIPNVAVGETYNVKVRHQSIYDVYSAYTSVSNITITAATEAPAAPTGITASTGKELNILVSFTNSSSADMKAVKIYRKTSSTTPTSDTDGLVHTMSGVNGQVSTWLDGKFNGLTAGTTYYYWAKAINTSDVASSLVGPAQGSFVDIDEFSIDDGSITNAKLAVDAIQGDVIAAGAITTQKLGVDAVTTAKIADNAITAPLIGANAIITSKLANAAVTEAVIAAGAITNTKIGADAVQTANIANDAITTDLIAAGAITATELGADAVTTAKIANDAITEDLIAAGAITTTLIADDAISTAKIAADAITADEIAANAVTANAIAANTITAGEIAAGAINTDELAANAITAAKIAANTITASEIAANAITASELAANSVTAAAIEAGTITATEIAANAITATEIAANTITASQIATGAITADEVAANAITAAAIATGTITATEMAANSITASEIAAGAVSTSELAADAVTADELAANSVTAAAIAANTITASEIAAGTITATEILAGTITATEIASGAITAVKIGANAVTAAKINVSSLSAISADMGTITAGSITAGTVAATTLNLNGATLTADANGLRLNLFDAFTHINTDTMGKIGGTAGQNNADNNNLAVRTEIQRSTFTGSDPRHIAATTQTSASPDIIAGEVMGGAPIFSFNFTTKAFSGTRPYIISAAIDFTGSSSSSSECAFAMSMRATTSATNYTSTSASSYILSEGISSSGSHSLGIHALNGVVNLSGNTEYYIWCFALADDGVSSYKSGTIQVFGLNK